MTANDTMHDELRRSVRSFVEGEGGTRRVRKARDTEVGFDREAWRRMAGLGWTGILLPEAHGGLGLGVAEAAIVAEELGRCVAAEPMVAGAVLAARAILHGDNAALQAELLPAIAAGVLLPAVAWQEGAGGMDPTAISVQAQPEGKGVRLSGRKRFVAHGLGADGYVVSALGGAGVGLYWVPGDSAGLAYEPQRRADGTESGTLVLDGVHLGADAVVAQPGHGGDALGRALDEALVVVSAELLGIAGRALEITLDYLRTRVQFGKPIGSFQALQHRSVDLFIQKELCRSALGAAVHALDAGAGGAERARFASRAKARCSDAAVEIARKSIQMHGAIGFTDECDIGLYLKRALVQSAWLGNGSVHRRRYAALA